MKKLSPKKAAQRKKLEDKIKIIDIHRDELYDQRLELYYDRRALEDKIRKIDSYR